MKRKYWDPRMETASREKISEVQTEKLKTLVHKVYANTVFYRKRFDEAGIKPDDIRALVDLEKIPLTSYQADFVATPVSDKLAVPMSEVACVLSTSGTMSGSPQLVMLSTGDLETWAGIMACLLTMAGVGKGDIVQPVFPGPSIVDRGVNMLGATMVPALSSSFSMDYTIKLMQNMKPTVLLSSPTLFMDFERRALELGFDLKKSGLHTCAFLGESWSNAFRERTEKERPIRFYDIYGLMELGMILGECQERNGMHCLDHLFILEIVDPETGKILGPGQPGEIVVTSLWREAMPLLRYRTGDMAEWLEYQPCRCGRTSARTSRIKGRIGHMIKVGKAKVFPADVEEVIHAAPELTGEYQIIVRKPETQEVLEIRAEHREGMGDLPALKSRLEKAFEKRTGARSNFDLVPRGTVPPGLRVKAQRIVRA